MPPLRVRELARGVFPAWSFQAVGSLLRQASVVESSGIATHRPYLWAPCTLPFPHLRLSYVCGVLRPVWQGHIVTYVCDFSSIL